jgi:GTPase SAR1 family protein
LLRRGLHNDLQVDIYAASGWSSGRLARKKAEIEVRLQQLDEKITRLARSLVEGSFRALQQQQLDDLGKKAADLRKRWNTVKHRDTSANKSALMGGYTGGEREAPTLVQAATALYRPGGGGGGAAGLDARVKQVQETLKCAAIQAEANVLNSGMRRIQHQPAVVVDVDAVDVDAVAKGWRALSGASPKVMLAEVAKNVRALQYVSAELQGLFEVLMGMSVSSAVTDYPGVVRQVAKSFPTVSRLVSAAVAKDAAALRYAVVQADRQVVLAALERNGSALQHVSAELQADRTVVLAAVTQNGNALEHASAELRADREVVSVAMAQNNGALRYASADLKAEQVAKRNTERLKSAMRSDSPVQKVRAVVESVTDSFDAKDEHGKSYRAIIAEQAHNLHTATPEELQELLRWAGIELRRGTILHMLSDDLAHRLVSQLVVRGGQTIVWLDLRDNQLTSVPEDIAKITQLQTLKLGGNKLMELPLALTELTHLKELELSGMPALERVVAIMEEKGISGVFDFLRDLHDDPQPSYSLKLVMAGPSMAGKTSLLNALRLGEPRLTDELTGRTIGLDINVLVLHDPRVPGGIRFLCYDAGGHGEYQEMHGIFLSPNTLYLLVWNVALAAKGGTDQARHFHEILANWADLIQSHCPGAAVQLVASHVDQVDDLSTVKQQCDKMLISVKDILVGHRIAQQEELHRLECAPTSQVASRQRMRVEKLKMVLKQPLRLENEVVVVSAKDLTGVKKLRRRMANAVHDVDAFPTFGQNQPKTYRTILREVKRLHAADSSVTWTQLQESLEQRPDVEQAAFTVTLMGTELRGNLHTVLDAAKHAQWSKLESVLFPARGCDCTLSAQLLNSVPGARSYGVLHQLAHHGAGEVYQRLLQRGATFDVTLLSKQGHTAEQIAENRGHVSFATLMAQASTAQESAQVSSPRQRIMKTSGYLGYEIDKGSRFVRVYAELTPQGVLTLNGAQINTMTVDLTQSGMSMSERKNTHGRPFCMALRQPDGAKTILDATSAVEQRRWLDATCIFAEDKSLAYRQYRFSVEICEMMVQEFTVRHRSAKDFHAELVEQGHCRGLKFPAWTTDAMREMVYDTANVARRGQELQQYYQELCGRRDILSLPLFKERMDFDLQMLCERRCKLATMARADPNLLRRAMSYLHLTGEVLYYEHVPALRDRVFLEPQRLVDIMKELMHHDLEKKLQLVSAATVPNAETVKALGEQFIKQGVLNLELLPWLWRNLEPSVTDSAQIQFLVSLLSEVGLLTRVPGAASQQWLLPMRLPDRNEVLVTAAARNRFASFLAKMEAGGVVDHVGLADATQAICDAGVLTRDDIERGCAVALKKAQQVLRGAERDKHGLTCDEIAAINFYTQEDMSANKAKTNIYRPLNRALRAQVFDVLRPYWQYIKLLQHALLKLPPAPVNLFRGINKPQPDVVLEGLLRQCNEKKPEVWWAFSSTTSQESVAKRFLKPTGKRVLYTVEGSMARDVKSYSDFPREDELLMPCGSSFVIDHAEASREDEDLLLVHLKQTGATLLEDLRLSVGSSAFKDLREEMVLEVHQHPALAALHQSLEAAGTAVDFVGRRHDFHQPLPPGFLASVISRCAKLCGEETSLWRRDLITVMVVSPENIVIEVSISQQGVSRVAFAGRCRAGGHHALCLCKLQLFEKEMLDVVKGEWAGCSTSISCTSPAWCHTATDGILLAKAEEAVASGETTIEYNGKRIPLAELCVGSERQNWFANWWGRGVDEPEPEPEPEPELDLTFPRWVADKDAPSCHLCECKFGGVCRRHHCRHCGRVICANCSRNRLVLKQWLGDGKAGKALRVCDECFGVECFAQREASEEGIPPLNDLEPEPE